MTDKTNILLIDDDIDEREIFEIVLSSIDKPLIINTAPNGIEALKVLKTPDIQIPDILFLDLNMPLMNGVQFLEIIKQDNNHKNIPVIIYSTSSDENDIRITRELGAKHFFIKPFDIKDVKQMLLKLFAGENLPYLLKS